MTDSENANAINTKLDIRTSKGKELDEKIEDQLRRQHGQISSIEPDMKDIMMDGEDAAVQPKFTYSTLAIESYGKNGFEPPQFHELPDFREREFLSGVDIRKGMVKVNIRSMFRVRAINWSSEKQEMKEYL